MKSLFVLLAALAAGAASAGSLCEAARADVDRVAQSLNLQAEVHCRGLIGRPVPAQAQLQGLGAPEGAAIRSGPLAWPVRVVEDGAFAYVQRVPLTVVWISPAWVAAHDLAPGARLQADDILVQTLHWPEGVTVEPANATRLPVGRLRRSLRAGDILASAALLPPGSLQRGDHVTAVLAEGAMEVRLPAQLLAPAQVGERARVQAIGRKTALEGRLIDAETLKVDGE